VIAASRAIAGGDHSVCIAGGVESMSRAPRVMLKTERDCARTNATLFSTTLGWRMVNPRLPVQWTVSLGEGAELLAAKYSISREEQDAFALRSHRQAAAAWDAGLYDGEVVAVPGTDSRRGESIRGDTSIEALAALRPAFQPGRDGDRGERVSMTALRPCSSLMSRVRGAPARSRLPAS
jgi:acetyl-CoA acetyltransferase